MPLAFVFLFVLGRRVLSAGARWTSKSYPASRWRGFRALGP